MEIVERHHDRLSRELSRLPSRFRLMFLSIGVGIVAGRGAILSGRTPVASVVMACEMSASYTLLVPPMLVSSTSYRSTWTSCRSFTMNVRMKSFP